MFRLKGYTRPVSVLKLRSAARNKFSSTAISTMEKMLTPKGRYCSNCVSFLISCLCISVVNVDGSIVGLQPASCVSTALLREIHSWKVVLVRTMLSIA